MQAGTARELVTVLEEMVLISEEQAREVARSREEASRIEQMLQQKGKDRIAGKAAPNPSAELLSANDSQLSGQHSKHSRRETSFLNAFHGLMHLYSDPATRSSAERIFELLREIRMIEIGDDPSKLVFEMAPVISASRGRYG